MQDQPTPSPAQPRAGNNVFVIDEFWKMPSSNRHRSRSAEYYRMQPRKSSRGALFERHQQYAQEAAASGQPVKCFQDWLDS